MCMSKGTISTEDIQLKSSVINGNVWVAVLQHLTREVSVLNIMENRFYSQLRMGCTKGISRKKYLKATFLSKF